MTEIKLLGKSIITATIEVKTGLRIGGTTTGLKIGGIDQPVISDALGRPYIPGSSLKGKMRSLIEKKEKVQINIKDKNGNPIRHECTDGRNLCPVCKIFGILGRETATQDVSLTRLIVRDTPLDENSITEEMKRNLELEWTEIKTETAINRVTGTALSQSLRSINRVPAGAKFAPMEIVYNFYEPNDVDIFKKVFEALELVEHDYLGGMGSRGYGKVEFKDIKIYLNTKEAYEKGNLNSEIINSSLDTPAQIVSNFPTISETIRRKLNLNTK